MKIAMLTILTVLGGALALPSFAHDPKEHQAQGATAPDCSKLKTMDASKMDVNDPVVKALQAKCKKQMEHEKMEQEVAKGAAGTHKTGTPPAASAAQKPAAATIDCSKMKNMDMSKMDMNDPAMKAMHDKCMKDMKSMKGMDHGAPPQGAKPQSGSGQ